ncbi:MAG: PKD domain-containing protein [Thermoplasmata archaeon]|nr:PKD domain-containing protein [Thermoplasmata archaeon]
MITYRYQQGICWISGIFLCAVLLFGACQLKRPPDQPPTLTASFTYSPGSPVADQPVQFTDTSTGSPSSWQWAFGDGSTGITQNPVHTYAAAESYGVTLAISAGSNSNRANRTITVSPEVAGYYIDANNPSANDSNAGTEALPWKTITKANQALAAGDTVYIKAGTYTNYIAPRNSGTASNRITYRAYGSDIVTVQNASYGILLDGKSYITVQGINFYNLDQFMYLANSANYNIIAFCNFDQGRNVGWSGSEIIRNSSYNWVHHCQFSKYGYYFSDDIGSILDIGNEESRTDLTGHNLIENNSMFHGGHHVLGVYGMYNVIRNNYFHNEPWSMGTADADRGAILYGDRNVCFSGYADNSGRNLFEGNQVGYSSDPPDNIGATGMLLITSYNIIRFNSFYHNDRAGLAMGLTSSYVSDIVYNRVYNNSFFHNGINTQDPLDHMNSDIGFGIYSGTYIIKYNAFKNNLLYRHRVPYGTYYVSLADQIFAGNWDGDAQGNPGFVSASDVLGDPMDSSLPNLHLISSSPCIDAGTYLTTITSSSGSGTTFVVADAGYFMDGWGITGVDGDEIQIVGTSQKARITKVDYGTNTITVNAALTWTQNQGIALSYVGAAPDAGAYEYGR